MAVTIYTKPGYPPVSAISLTLSGGDSKTYTPTFPGGGIIVDDEVGVILDYTPEELPSLTRQPNTSYRDLILSTVGLQSYWRLGETSGATAADSKGAMTGTCLGGYTRNQPGAIVAVEADASTLFDGDAAATWCTTSLNPGYAQGSIECWGYATDLNNRSACVYTGNDNGISTASHQIGVTSTGQVKGFIFTSGIQVITSPTGLVTPNTWHHHVVTWQDGGNFILYVDGTSRASLAIGTTYKAGNRFLLARRGTGGVSGFGSSWQGRLDEFAVYNAVLSPATVLAHYNRGLGLS